MVTQKDQYLPKTERLGEILVRRNVVSREELKEALQLQRKEKKCLGEILVKLGYVDEIDIVVALVIQCNLPYIAVDKYEIDLNIIRLVPKEVARRNMVVPLDCVGNVLSLVMADPLNIKTRQEVQQLTHCCIAPFIGLRFEIEQAITRWYGGE